MRKGYIWVLLIAIYAALDPFRLSPIANFPDFKSHYVDAPPFEEIEIPGDFENLLQKADITTFSGVPGPESLAFDPQNRGPYTGVADGRILRWDGPSIGWSYFAHTSPNRLLLNSIVNSNLYPVGIVHKNPAADRLKE